MKWLQNITVEPSSDPDYPGVYIRLTDGNCDNEPIVCVEIERETGLRQMIVWDSSNEDPKIIGHWDENGAFILRSER